MVLPCLAIALAILTAVPTAADAPPVLAGPLTSAEGAPNTGPRWKQAVSTNFTAVGDADDQTMQAVLAELEAFRDALAALFPAIRFTGPAPQKVVVFKDRQSFSRFLPRDKRGRRDEALAGYFLAAADVIYMVIGAPGSDGEFARRVVLHEYTHHLLHRNLPGIPLWLDEGLADYYSTFKFEPGAGRILIGAPPSLHLETTRDSPLLPLEKMLSTQGTSGSFRNGHDRALFYAQSWALVHYLMLGHGGKRHNQLGAYVSSLLAGLAPEKSFHAAFGCTYRQMERELRWYVGGYAFPVLAIPREERTGSAVAAVRPMPDGETEALQGDLLVRLRAQPEAEQVLGRALGTQPSHPAARLSLALLRLDQGQPSAGIDILQELAREDSQNFAAFVHLARALASANRPDAALRAAERATVLNEQSPAAWFALARAALLADRGSQAEAAMVHVLQLDPDPYYYRARAYEAFNHGKDAAAAHDAAAFLARAGGCDESTSGMVFLAALAHRRRGEPADADRMLAQVRPSLEAGSWTEKVLQFFQVRITADQLVKSAKGIGQQTEAHAYAGFHDLIADRRAAALAHFQWVKEHGAADSEAFGLVMAALGRLDTARGQ